MSATEGAPAGGSLVDDLFRPAEKRARALAWICGVGFAILFVWAAFVPIDRGAVAMGRVSPEARRTAVQHPEGGVIAEVYVREGARVEAGQLLARLEDSDARARVEILQGRADALAAEEAALQAEVTGAASIAFPRDLLDRAEDPRVAEILRVQTLALQARRASIGSRGVQLVERDDQAAQAIAGARAQIDAKSGQLRLLQEEITGLERLYAQGFASRTRLLALQRAAQDLEGQIAELRASVGRFEAQRQEFRAERGTLGADGRRDAADRLGRVGAERASVLDELSAARVRLARTEVKAPVTGSVVGLTVNTAGDVLSPGGKVAEIVPEREMLRIVARVPPQDADAVRASRSATVMFDAAGARNAPRVRALVETVSADAIEDERSGQSYFQVVVRVPPEEAARLPDMVKQPGLPAEVLINTGSRTPLQYMLDPLTRSMSHALRED